MTTGYLLAWVDPARTARGRLRPARAACSKCHNAPAARPRAFSVWTPRGGPPARASPPAVARQRSAHRAAGLCGAYLRAAWSVLDFGGAVAEADTSACAGIRRRRRDHRYGAAARRRLEPSGIAGWVPCGWPDHADSHVRRQSLGDSTARPVSWSKCFLRAPGPGGRFPAGRSGPPSRTTIESVESSMVVPRTAR